MTAPSPESSTPSPRGATPRSTTRASNPASEVIRASAVSSTATTDGVRVTVRPAFWPERSQPQSGQVAFTYTVQISNVGTAPVQLVSRHWIITDGNGRV